MALQERFDGVAMRDRAAVAGGAERNFEGRELNTGCE
jgi:hypothetical protein